MAKEGQNIGAEGGNPPIDILPEKKSIDAIIDMSPDLKDELIRYDKKISQLSSEEQQSLIEQWKDEIKNENGNIGVFQTILRNIKDSKLNKEKEVVKEEKEVVKEEKEVVKEEKEVVKEEKEVVNKKKEAIKEEDEITKQRNIASQAAKTANDIATKINTKLNGKYNGEIQEEMKQDIGKPETQKYLATLGIDASKPENLATGEVQNILLARASTQVMLRNQENILKESPDSLKDIKNLSSLRFTLGLGDKTEAKNVGNLLIDQPRSDRETITSTVNSLTQGAPDTLITRTGDRLTFSDPRNERYSYEIDMSKQPPRLAKTLNGLSITRDVVGLSPEQREKKAAYETAKGKLDKGEQKYSQGINEFWGARRGEYTLTGTSVEKGEDGKETKKDINIYSSIFLSENRWKQNQYEMIEQELATGNLTSENRGGKLETMIQLTRDMKSTNLSQMLDTGETENHSKINTMLEQRYEKITQLQKANQEIVEAKTEVSKNPQNTENQYNNFDSTARDNLSWLVENRFDRMGPNANKALQQIIDSINIDEPSSTIDLTRPMEQQDHKRLIKKLEKLGGTPDVLTNGDKLPVFQQKITMAASKNPDDPNSIRGLLTTVETPSSTK